MTVVPVWLYRVEGEPLRALSGLVPVALHPVSVCSAGCLRPPAADLRPAPGVHPQLRPALLLQPGAPARTALLIGLLQVRHPDRLGSPNDAPTAESIEVHIVFLCFLVGPRCTEAEAYRHVQRCK